MKTMAMHIFDRYQGSFAVTGHENQFISTLKQTYTLINKHFTHSFFLTKAAIILNEFNLIMSTSMDQSLEVFQDSFH